MYSTLVKMKCLTILLFSLGQLTNAYITEYRTDFSSQDAPNFNLLHVRYRRDVTPSQPAMPPSQQAIVPSQPAMPPSVPPSVSSTPTKHDANVTEDSNRTVNMTVPASTQPSTHALPSVAVTLTPLLGFNGSGIRQDNATNLPKVSEPIQPEDNYSDSIFGETPEKVQAEQNITNLSYDNHDFYNSTFIGNKTYFDEFWANITKPKAEVHAVLSHSHRKASTQKLSFDFPFYGHWIRNITLATGGFIYTGEHVHNWLAATQYIAPLMANFDTTYSNESVIKYYDDGEKFTAIWEKVNLQEDANKNFTFAVTLFKNGEIVFAYKDIPIPIDMINDKEHPVKLGISDAYLNDKIIFFVRRKTIYEYHRVSFRNHEVASGTLLKLIPLPTCLQYDSCEACTNHNTGFECLWCPHIRKCSSGTDRNKQDWNLRNCDKYSISNSAMCPKENGTELYDTYTQAPPLPEATQPILPTSSKAVNAAPPEAFAPSQPSAMGAVVAVFISLAILSSVVAWFVYAFRNPHTKSGQLLIKYRPSEWSWRRGEARYTAATIHM